MGIMKDTILKKISAIMLIVVLILNLVFFGLSKISTLLFWIIIGLCFAGSYLIKKFKF